MTDLQQIRVAVIGCGRIAQTHLMACQQVAGVEVAAVVDTNAEAAQGVAEQFNCDQVFTDYADMLEQVDTDAAIICTPNAFHAPIAIDLAQHGVHVLCEKPLATTVESAAAMRDAAEQNNTLLMMASKFRFVEDVVKARGVVRSGILGQVVLMEVVFCSHVDMSARWNSDPELAGGGVLIDNGTHAVDMARFLLGPVKRVQALHGKRIQPLEVEDTTRLYFETESGVLGAVDLSWSIHKEIDNYLALYGSEGTLNVGFQRSRYRQSEKLDWVTFGSGYDKQAAFNRQLEHFTNCIRGVEQPTITLEDSVASVAVVAAGYQAAEENRWHAVEVA